MVVTINPGAQCCCARHDSFWSVTAGVRRITADMDIRIDTSSDVPIRRQLTEQVIFLIATERLQHGDLLPSVRELARRLKVHHNTVSEAYQDLVRRKWLERRRGSRLFLLDLVERFDEKRKTTCGNQSRNGGNFVNTSVNQHESPADIFAGCQPNTFQMPPRYHTESWLPSPAMSK